MNFLRNTSLFIATIALSSLSSNTVEHKDEYIFNYLSGIESNMEEKTQLLEHVRNNLNGTYVDIGTGGDAIAVLLEGLPKEGKATLIAADIDPHVLEAIPQRRPEIKPYLDGKEEHRVNLMELSATDMHQINDNSISGIGASALTHEVFSYVPPREGVDLFISEVCRVLEKDGVFVYRDPQWVSDPQTRALLVLKSELSKYFASAFLPKFLDREFSRIKNFQGICSKPAIYNPNEIFLNVFDVQSQSQIKLSYQEFLITPSPSIDYSMGFSIEAPKGLISEIQRHYIIYLKSYSPINLIDSTDGDLNLNELDRSSSTLIKKFALRKSIPCDSGVIKHVDVLKLKAENKILRSIYKNRIQLEIPEDSKISKEVQNLTEKNVWIKRLFSENQNLLTIDPKFLPLIHQTNQELFSLILNSSNTPLDFLEFMKCEGEEHYFYKTTDAWITYIGQLSQHLLKATHKKNLVLAPISPDHIKKIPRDFYKTILTREMLCMDFYGHIQNPTTEKSIIHFQMQPVNKAITVYRDIIKSDPDRYKDLNKYVNDLELQMQNS